MSKNSKKDTKFQYEIKLTSKVFPGLSHTSKVNLFCYEKLPSESQFEKEAEKYTNLKR